MKDADAAGALAALADLVAPHEDTAGVHAVETRFDAERGYVECPACGAEAAPGAAECPECGLGLAGGDEASGRPAGLTILVHGRVVAFPRGCSRRSGRRLERR